MTDQLTDTNYNTIVLAIIGGVNTIILAIIATVGTIWVAKINKSNAAVAERVVKVKDALAESDHKTDSTLNKIHTLVNSNMGIQLRLNASNARFKADTTHDPIDIEAADLAEHMLREHEGKQALVDGGV